MQESVETGGRDSSCAAPAVPSKPEPDNKVEEKRSELEWNARYNSAVCDDCAGFYSFCDKACSSVVALFGTYTFVSVFIGLNYVYAAVSIFVSALSVTSLVVGFGAKSFSESNRRLVYDKLLAEIKQAKDLTHLEDIERRLVDASVDEPKRPEIVRAAAYNEASGQMGCSESYNVEIGWFKWITRFIFPWKRPSYKVLQGE
ncbi:MAG: hypothetical protein IKM81_05575 [Fibrobacter sp.]|nr:hypothetical protein [Fibrobacter sp.]